MAGGMVAQLTKQNSNVVYVIVTNGDKGCTPSMTYNCSALSNADVAVIREKEARAAAAVLGVTQLEFLGVGDGQVTEVCYLARARDTQTNRQTENREKERHVHKHTHIYARTHTLSLSLSRTHTHTHTHTHTPPI